MILLLARSAWAGDEIVGKQVINGHFPAEFARAPLVGKLGDDAVLHLAIGLPLKDPARLDTVLKELYDPKSPSFHQFLSPEQFAREFGASEKDYRSLIDFVRAHGMSVATTYPDRLMLAVAGTAAAVDKAFHISLTTKRRPDGSVFYAPDREPSVDLDTRIFHITGLDNFELPKPASSGGSGPGGSLGGADFRNAYAQGVSLNGQGQTVGLFELDGFYQADITGYTAQFPEFATRVPPVTVVATLDGFVSSSTQSGPPKGGCNPATPLPANTPPAGTPGTGDGEPAVDIEMAIAMAPGLDHVYVYEGCNGAEILKAMTQPVKEVLPKQLSASWSIPTDANSVVVYKQMSAAGQSFLWAVGDNNTTCPEGAQAVRSTMPGVTSVGGTNLTMSNNGATWQSETAAADGGGLLAGFAIPGYQQDIAPNVANPNNLWMAPDVAMMSGDGSQFGVFAYYQRQSYGYFGTSVAAPLWAGYVALINQQRSQRGFEPVGSLGPALYEIGLSPTRYAQDFHDITLGTSPAPPASNCSNGVSHSAGPGYDLVTGLGSPQAHLITDMATLPAYPLYCQGPLVTSSAATPLTPFKWSNQGAGVANPAPGHCAWADRGPRGSEIKHGNVNVISGELGPVANLPAGKFSAVGVYRARIADNDLVVTEIIGLVSPPFSSNPVLPP